MSVESLSREFLSFQRALAGRYSLRQELGRGGMGIVFLARDLSLERNVAIKLLPQDLAALPEFRGRFLREARVAAQLSHPNIVAIHSVEEAGPFVFFVMGLVDGGTFGERIRQIGQVPPDEVARVLQQTAWALAHAHAQGVSHRDIKPDNILLASDGRAMVSDFGIASGVLGTNSGEVAVGTPHYMSPEQAAGGPAGPLADLYALGVTAWYALVGRHPIDAPTVTALLLAKHGQDAPPVQTMRADVPMALAEIVDRLLQRDPEKRFASADELARKLDYVRALVPSVPRSVRDLASATLSLPEEALAVGTAIASSTALGVYFSSGGNLFDGIIGASAGAAMSGLAIFYGAFRLTRWVGLVRGAVREGASRRDVLRCAEQLRDEEQRISRNWRSALWLVPVGVASTAGAYWLAAQADVGVIGFIALVAAGVLPVPFVWRLAKLRWSKRRPVLGWLRGKFGQWLFNAVGRWGSKQSAATSLPTATLLGADVQTLLRQLPEAQQRQFAEIPLLVESLQQEALLLRDQGKDSTRRVNDIHAALDGIRLELLAVRLDRSDSAELTAWIDRAREVGRRVSSELALPKGEGTPT